MSPNSDLLTSGLYPNSWGLLCMLDLVTDCPILVTILSPFADSMHLAPWSAQTQLLLNLALAPEWPLGVGAPGAD